MNPVLMVVLTTSSKNPSDRCDRIAAPQAGNLGWIPTTHTNCQDWWLSPSTGGKGDLDGDGDGDGEGSLALIG